LMRRSEVVDFQTLNPGKTPAKRKKPRPTATSIDQIQEPSTYSEQLPPPVISISPEPEEVEYDYGAPYEYPLNDYPNVDNFVDEMAAEINNDYESDYEPKNTQVSKKTTKNVPTARKGTTAYPAVKTKSPSMSEPEDYEDHEDHETHEDHEDPENPEDHGDPEYPEDHEDHEDHSILKELNNGHHSATDVIDQEEFEEVGIDPPESPKQLNVENRNRNCNNKSKNIIFKEEHNEEEEEDDDSIPDFDYDDQEL